MLSLAWLSGSLLGRTFSLLLLFNQGGKGWGGVEVLALCLDSTQINTHICFGVRICVIEHDFIGISVEEA